MVRAGGVTNPAVNKETISQTYDVNLIIIVHTHTL